MANSLTTMLRNSWPLVLAVGCSATEPAPATHPSPHASCVGEAPNPGLGAYDSALIAQLQASSFVFRATVTAVHASTLPGPNDLATSVIVHVDTTVYASSEMAELVASVGPSITIALRAANLAVGDQTLIMTTLHEYNGALGVTEIARVDEAAHPSFATDAPRMMQLFAANLLYARIASSRSILTGSVETLDPPEVDPGASEHSPIWQLAHVATGDVLCGPAMTDLVDAGFASSVDIAWYTAPKLALGQDAILLLHHSELPEPFATTVPERIVIDQDDTHPLADLAAIQALLASPPPLP
jgi:hypothetical protein